MRKIGLLLMTLPALFFLVSCGGSATTPVTPSSLPISVEYLDGAADVALDSTFKATFSQAVDTNTVTTETFFVVEGGSADISAPIRASKSLPFKAAYDPSLCVVGNAIASTVSCASNTECTLDPTNNLSSGTQYTLCLTTGILYADGTAYGGTRATFTTGAVTASVIDAWGRAVNGNTSVNPTALRIMFSEDMHLATVIDPNISLTCGGAVQAITITQAQTPEQTASLKTFDVTHSLPDSIQLLNCTLDITAAVQTLAGASVTAASHAFTNACAIDDTFSTNTTSCWSVSTGGTYTWQTWPELLANILMFNGSDLVYNTAGQAGITNARINKQVTFLPSGFQLTVNVSNPTGFNSGTDYDDLLKLDLRNNNAGDIRLYVGITNVVANPYVDVSFVNASTGDNEMKLSVSALDSPANYSITLTVDTTNGMQASYTRNDESLPLQPWIGTGFPTAGTINAKLLQYAGETWILDILFNGESDLSATITSISTTGLTSATQY